MDPAILSQGEKLGEQQQPCALWGEGTEAGLRWGGDRRMVAALNRTEQKNEAERPPHSHQKTWILNLPQAILCGAAQFS